MSGDCNTYGGFVAGSGGGTTDTVWGDITGNISNQKDLIRELEKKVNKEENEGLSSNDFTNKNKEKLDKVTYPHHLSRLRGGSFSFDSTKVLSISELTPHALRLFQLC